MDHTLLERILNISRLMAETRQLTPLLNYVLDEAVALVGAERGYLVLVQAEGELDFRVTHHHNGKTIAHAETEISRSVLNEVIESGQPLTLQNAIEDPRFAGSDSVAMLQLRSIMCVPLIARGDVIGAIYVENRSIRNRFAPADLAPLLLFANQAAVAVENAALNDDLEARVTIRTQALETAKAQVEQSWAEAIEANRLRTVWLGNVTHDLGAPLTIVSGSLALLEDGTMGPLNELQMNWVIKSRKAIDHINSLLNDLFDLSKLEAGGLKLNLETINLADFLQTAYEVGQGLAWPPTVALRLDADWPLPDVIIDPVRINQVVFNLLTNAQKFTAQGSVTIHANHVVGDDIVQIGVQDTGEGIPADKVAQVFERFQQVDQNLTRRRRGTGLGLAVCQELVEMHGGQIWLESELGVGSNFIFTLPLA